MAYSAIVKPQDYFNTVLYTGNGGTQTISGVGFQPDFLWIKNRSGAGNHMLQNAVRGSTKHLHSNTSDIEVTDATGVTSFNSDGFAVSSNGNLNGNGTTTASWNWLANGTGSANTDGATNTTVSVNTTAGFSIVNWTGTGSATTLGHGLGAVPKFWIIKNLDQVEDWRVYHNSLGNTKMLELNNTNAEASDISYWNNTSPTSSVMTVGSSNANNGSGRNMIAYCFAEKTGYSKFGSYTGNGSADGTFFYTGFKPAFCIIKRVDTTDDWLMVDNKRVGYNGGQYYLLANTSDNEDGGAGDRVDILSNGLKMNNSWSKINASGGTYIYMAFAENPLVANSGTNGVPATAR